MAPENTIGDVQHSPPPRVLPALPPGAVRIRPCDVTSPISSSPLHVSAILEQSNAAIVDENGGVKLSTTPDGTPPGSGSPTKMAEPTNATQDITPPDSRYTIQGPLVIDGSIHRHATNEETRLPVSPSQVVQHTLPEDPFISSPSGKVQKIQNPAGMPHQQILSLIGANLAHSRETASSLPRQDRIGQPVGVHNAQGLFPARAVICVFNLSNLKTNDQLQVSVESVFFLYGTCYVKIKRDVRYQPHAIIQYELIADADKALEDANGCEIDGRVVRVERGNVPRSVIVSLLSNEAFSEDQLREALSDQGQIESITATGPAPANGQHNLAYLVKFEYFEDCRDVVKMFRHNTVWRIVPAPKEKRIAPYPIAAPRTPQGNLYQDNDSHSVFLGGLPDSVTEDELRALLSMFGTIDSINIISKPMTTGGMNTFAFVSFKYIEDAQSAGSSTQYLHGQKIRVERKQYSSRRAARVASSIGTLPHPTLTPQTPHFLASRYHNAGGMAYPTFQGTPYSGSQQPFTLEDYHTTPPTPVYMVQYGQYASPAPRMRQPSPHYGHHQLSHNMQYGNSFSPLQGNQGSMHAIAEEQDGGVFT